MSVSLATRGWIPFGTSTGGGGGGSSSPVVSNVSPAPGFDFGPSTPIQFDITDQDNAFALILPMVVLDPLKAPELVHNWWDDFEPIYKLRSSRIEIFKGFRYTMLRKGGWPVIPGLRLYAVDVAGNVWTG